MFILIIVDTDIGRAVLFLPALFECSWCYEVFWLLCVFMAGTCGHSGRLSLTTVTHVFFTPYVSI